MVELPGEATLTQGRHDEAGAHGHALADRGAALGCELAVAHGARLQG